MIRFECDYLDGAPMAVLEAIAKADFEQNPGYGDDHHCDRAKELIKKACGDDSLGVAFLVGGTQTNLTVIASALKSYQGVIAPFTAHINNHETGAIEATGHKVIAVDVKDGKITADQIRYVCKQYWDDTHCLHIVQPGMNNYMAFFNSKLQTKNIWVKRVIGRPGDKLAFHDNHVWRNGEMLDEPYTNEKMIYSQKGEITVPEGYVFVMRK